MLEKTIFAGLYVIALLYIWRSRPFDFIRTRIENWALRQDRLMFEMLTCDACLGFWVLIFIVMTMFYDWFIILPAYALVVVWATVKIYMERDV